MSNVAGFLKYYNTVFFIGDYSTRYEPEKVIKNSDIEELLDISEDLLQKIKSLRIDENENTLVFLPLEYEYRSRILYPFSIPFTIKNDDKGDCKIYPPKEGFFPALSFDFLSPKKNSYPSLGQINVFIKGATEIKHKEYKSWGEYINDVFSFFEKITGKKVGEDMGEGFNWGTLGVCKSSVSTTKHLKNLCRTLTRNEEYHTYYKKLIHENVDSSSDIEEMVENLKNIPELISKFHLGHINKEFPLSRTQREAIHSWILFDSIQNPKSGHMRVMAINGPPGTGKTTFLSDLIASHIVRSVLDNKYPRFILTSFTNKAVTNILDSLSHCAEDVRLIETEEEIGLSIHFSSGESNYPCLNKQGQRLKGTILEIEEKYKSEEEVRNYINKVAEKFHLRFFYDFSLSKKLEKISSFFQEQVVNEFKEITSLRDVKNIEDFDTTHRFEAYKWAIRWLECEWLRKRPKITDVHSEETMKWRMMLTPCVVGTVHKLPQFFVEKEVEDQEDYKYWFESADYLIIDEAGQGSPELAVPLFGLAKNAIIVGDTEQLQPVWNISSENDYVLQTNCLESEQFDETISASKGSIMKIAQRICPIKTRGHEVRGVTLLNHRRCYEEIIGLSNRLCYNNQGFSLETDTVPRNSSYYSDDEKKDPVYPLGMIEVNGQCKKDSTTGSYVNKEEIEEIVYWVRENWEDLVDAYVKEDELNRTEDKRYLIKDVLAILTPYRGQERKIIAALKQENLYIEGYEIVVGTVHKLQGAEKAVILLSTVQDGKNFSNPDFIDKHMLNVAVSRAKKSFIVFSNPNLYESVKKGSPLDIMKKYIDDWTKSHPFVTDTDEEKKTARELERIEQIFRNL